MKIALFGTSADPPTLAHQAILVWLAQHFDQVAVWAADNPFKQGPHSPGHHAAPLGDRQGMLKLLVEELRKSYGNIEIWADFGDRRSLISVQRAQQHWGTAADYSLVVGSDLISQIPHWFAVEQLLSLVTLLIFPRPGYACPQAALAKLVQLGGKYQLLAAGDGDGQNNTAALTPPISSSAYRRTGDADLIPPVVQRYIEQKELYPPPIFLENLAATHRWGQRLGAMLSPGAIILLSGDLGTGKTSLVQGMAKGLGIAEAIVSPTFNIINEYHEGRCPLYHLDLYRLNPLEVEYLYPEQYWLGEDFPLGVVAVEWPERLPFFPSQYVQIHLNQQGEGRGLIVEGKDYQLRQLLGQISEN